MIFVILFVGGSLVVPILLDSQKHGSDNIFKRSGRDVLEFEPVSKAIEAIHLSVEKISRIGAWHSFLFLLKQLVEVVRSLLR